MSAGKENENTLISLFNTIGKRKCWLTGTFFLVLIAGIIISFVRSPVYKTDGILRLTNNYVYYNDIFYKYFPEEAGDMWIFPTEQDAALERKVLYSIQKIIESGGFLEDIVKELDNRISKDKLAEILDIRINESMRYLRIYVIHSHRELVEDAIGTIFDSLVQLKSEEFEALRSEVVDQIDIEASRIESSIRELEAGDESDTVTAKEIDAIFSDLHEIEQLKRRLEEDPRLFTDRIEIVSRPGEEDVEKLNSVPRDIIISLFAALILGIITALIADFFIILRKK